MPKPNFLIVGTQKAGTTWLRYNLYKHRDITGSTRQLHYFDKHFSRGDDWYENQFPLTDKKFVGEKTTEYFDIKNSEVVAERITRYSSEMKIIVILRNPVMRAISALKHMVNVGREEIPEDINAALFLDKERESSHGYIDRGCYFSQLKHFYCYFPADQILVLIYEEDVVAYPLEGLNKVTNFLDVDAYKNVPEPRPVNKRAQTRFTLKLRKMTLSLPYLSSILWRVDDLLGGTKWEPAVDDNLLSKLTEYYKKDVIAVEKLIGRSLSSWRI